MTRTEAEGLAFSIHEERANVLTQLQAEPNGEHWLLCAYVYDDNVLRGSFQLFAVFSEGDWNTWDAEFTKMDEADRYLLPLLQRDIKRRSALVNVVAYLPPAPSWQQDAMGVL